jgi:NTP pyrophosphatase (non-canonical NTP hydrolase)
MEEDNNWSFDQIADAVKEWGYNKNIVHPGNMKRQFDKFESEVVEFKEAFEDLQVNASEENYTKWLLELGDVLVTLVMVAACDDTDLRDALFAAYNKIQARKGQTINGQFVKDV